MEINLKNNPLNMEPAGKVQETVSARKYISARQYFILLFKGERYYNEKVYYKNKEQFLAYRETAKDKSKFTEPLEDFRLKFEEYEKSITPAFLEDNKIKKAERKRLKEQQRQEALEIERKFRLDREEKTKNQPIKSKKPISHTDYDKRNEPFPVYRQFREAVEETKKARVVSMHEIRANNQCKYNLVDKLNIKKVIC